MFLVCVTRSQIDLVAGRPFRTGMAAELSMEFHIQHKQKECYLLKASSQDPLPDIRHEFRSSGCYIHVHKGGPSY